MTRRTAKRPAVRVRWELEEYTLVCQFCLIDRSAFRRRSHELHAFRFRREGDAIASVMAVPGSEEEELAAVEGGENPAPAATDETPAAEQ